MNVMNASLNIDLFLSARYTHNDMEMSIGVKLLLPYELFIDPDTSTIGKKDFPSGT